MILSTDILKDLNEKCTWSENLKMLICCSFGLICQKCAMLNNFSVISGLRFSLSASNLKIVSHTNFQKKSKQAMGHCSKV